MIIRKIELDLMSEGQVQSQSAGFDVVDLETELASHCRDHGPLLEPEHADCCAGRVLDSLPAAGLF